MKISGTMVKALLNYVTAGYFDDHSEMPETAADVADLVANMRIVAERSGDLPWLKLAIAHLIADEAEDPSRFAATATGLSAADMRDLLYLVWEALFPGEAPPAPGEGPEVELVPMTAEDWRAYRSSVYGD